MSSNLRLNIAFIGIIAVSTALCIGFTAYINWGLSLATAKEALLASLGLSFAGCCVYAKGRVRPEDFPRKRKEK